MKTKNVFMVMPFSDEISGKAYSHCVKPLCEKYNLEIRRADELFTINPIYDDIVREIQEATIVIADITGRNANVFYELGIAHTLKQNRTIILSQDEYDTTPFDVSHFRIIKYADTIDGTRKLEEELQKSVEYLLRDLKAIHNSEFEVIRNVLSRSNKGSELYSLIGLSNYPGIVSCDDSLIVAGYSPDGSYSAHNVSNIEDAFVLHYKMEYAVSKNNQIAITELGKAFSEHLSDAGFGCDKFNDQTYTEGFQEKYKNSAAFMMFDN